MTSKTHELTTAEWVLGFILVLIFMLTPTLVVAWALLWAWSLLGPSLGLAPIPISLGTVIATTIVLAFLRTVFKREA
ncbi:hypothetical protein [Candidatus Sodalis sp. SoCistrobi]|uniref:hypothetical protein n=1 Tax=Candidatus Sodalis sp. SoCistrobi TaxID=1922216 RepID=UPI000F79B60A|nr:hypothetical protein [Candidatus Sodalis sp. SoCistrobi]